MAPDLLCKETNQWVEAKDWQTLDGRLSRRERNVG
jgi:hypothetical protein